MMVIPTHHEVSVLIHRRISFLYLPSQWASINPSNKRVKLEEFADADDVDDDGVADMILHIIESISIPRTRKVQSGWKDYLTVIFPSKTITLIGTALIQRVLEEISDNVNSSINFLIEATMKSPELCKDQIYLSLMFTREVPSNIAFRESKLTCSTPPLFKTEIESQAV
ncbi:hypothetical protein Tco_1107119 [Tanacetum coccineum]